MKTRRVTGAGEVVPTLPETGRTDDEWGGEAGIMGLEAGLMSVMMGYKAVSCLAGQGWEDWASARKVQAYSNSEAISSSVLISSCWVSSYGVLP